MKWPKLLAIAACVAVVSLAVGSLSATLTGVLTREHSELAIVPAKVDLGVKTRGEELTTVVRLENRGDRPCVVRDSVRSCSCTTVFGAGGESQLFPFTIPPHSSESLTIRINTRTKFGTMRESIEIVTDSPVQPKVTAVVEAQIQGFITAVPESVTVVGAPRDSMTNFNLELRLVGNDRSPDITRVESGSGHLNIHCTPLEGVLGTGSLAFRRLQRLEVSVRPSDFGGSARDLRDEILVYESNHSSPDLHIPVRITVQPNLSLVPGRLLLRSSGAGSPNTLVNGTAVVRMSGPSWQARIGHAPRGVSARLEAPTLGPGRSQRLVVEWGSVDTGETGVLTENITIIAENTESGEQEEVVLPIYRRIHVKND